MLVCCLKEVNIICSFLSLSSLEHPKNQQIFRDPAAIRREAKGKVLTTPPRPSTSDFPKCEVTWQVDGQGCVDRDFDSRETHWPSDTTNGYLIHLSNTYTRTSVPWILLKTFASLSLARFPESVQLRKTSCSILFNVVHRFAFNIVNSRKNNAEPSERFWTILNHKDSAARSRSSDLSLLLFSLPSSLRTSDL